MDDYLIGKIDVVHTGKRTWARHRLVFTFLLASVAALTVARADSASPAVATDVASPTAASAPAAVAPVSGNQANGMSGGQTNPAPPPIASTSRNTTLVADNQAVGNATPAASGTTTAPATTSGGTPLVGAGSTPPTPVIVGYTGSKLPFRFSLTLNNVYDDNIYIRDINRVGDFYTSVIPGIEYKSREVDTDLDSLDTEPENYFHFAYKPEFTEFWDQTQNDFIDQHVTANYLLTLTRFQLGIDSGYNTSHYPNIDFGGRLKATYYTSRIYWQYALSNRLTLGGNVAMVLSRYNQGINTDDWSTTAYLDYELTGKIKLGLGTTLGLVDIDDANPNQDYEQFYTRATYQIRDKISLTGQAGAEVREYGNNTTTAEPSFALGVLYQPFDSTTVLLQGRRRSVPSIAQTAANYNDTDVSFSVRQRVFQKVFLQLKASYEHDDYFYVATGNATGLTYDYYTVSPSLEWDWNKYLKFTAYYEYQENDSSTPLNGFYDNSAGIGAQFSF